MEPVYGFVGNEDSGCIRCAAAPGDEADGDHHLECQDAAYSNSHSSRSSPCVNWLRDAECTEKSPGLGINAWGFPGRQLWRGFCHYDAGSRNPGEFRYRRSIDDHQSLYGKYLCVCRRDHHNHRDLNARLFYKSHTIHYDFSRSGIKLFIYRSDHPDPVFLR